MLRECSGARVVLDHPEAFAAAVVSLLRSPWDQKRLGFAGRRHVVEKFSVEAATDRVIEIYRNVAPDSCRLAI